MKIVKANGNQWRMRLVAPRCACGAMNTNRGKNIIIIGLIIVLWQCQNSNSAYKDSFDTYNGIDNKVKRALCNEAGNSTKSFFLLFENLEKRNEYDSLIIWMNGCVAYYGKVQQRVELLRQTGEVDCAFTFWVYSHSEKKLYIWSRDSSNKMKEDINAFRVRLFFKSNSIEEYDITPLMSYQ